MTALEETMEGVETVLIEGRQVQVFDGAVQVPIMGVTEALFMIGTMARHITGAGVLIMEDSEGILVLNDQVKYMKKILFQFIQQNALTLTLPCLVGRLFEDEEADGECVNELSVLGK